MMKNNRKSFFVLICVFFISVFSAYGASGNTLDLYNKGLAYQEDENFYLAQQYYLEVVAANPAFSDAWYKLAECCYKLGEFELGLQYLEKAEKYEKNNSQVKNLKAMILISMGKLNDAKVILNDILKKYPNDIDAHFGLAEIELYEGRYSGAEAQYSEALKRQNTNRKALLSLALVSAEKGKFSQAENYLRTALAYYSGDPEVHYLAAIVYSMKKDLKTAEKHARIAVEVKNDFEKAYEFLTTILYQQERYSEVIDLSDYLIGTNRSNSIAWYLKGIALAKSGRTAEAINVWSTGLGIQPQDEFMRFAMEMEVRNILSVEDNRRITWAKYHVDNARQYKSRYDGAGAVYEYQRALLLNPTNYEARKAYAEILELNGMHEMYLNQLQFIKAHNSGQIKGRNLTELNDRIEAFSYLLDNTLADEWDVEPFYLDKTRWNIAIFYEDSNNSFIHADTNRLAARAAADVFSGVAITSVKTQVTPIGGYGEAFKNARANNFDYFVMLSLSEGQNDLTLSAKMYSGRTGLEIFTKNFYSTGNNKFSTVLRRFRNTVLSELTVRGKILKRNGKTVLVDLGRAENVVKDARFKIIKKGCIKTADNGAGVFYSDSDVLGELVITRSGEEVSEAEIENQGFYDRINLEDEVVLISTPSISQPSNATGNAVDNVPAADSKGKAVVKTDVKGDDLVNDIRKAVERPSILDLLRNIY